MLRADHRFANAQKFHQQKWMLLLGAILLIVLGTLPLTAWAGEFPGKGSREKWEEAKKYNSLGLRQAKEENYTEAKASFQKAIDTYDQDPSFYHNVALVCELRKQSSEAEQYYKNALKVYPDYGPSWINLGHLYKTLGKTQDSLRSYKNALKCNLNQTARQDVDSSISVLESKLTSSSGEDHYKHGKYDKALTDLDKAIALDNKNGQAYYLRGKVYEKLGKASNAESDFARSKELDYKPKQGE